MSYLTTYSPLAASGSGFPRKGGVPYLPGALLQEALLSAALAYAIRRDEAFAAEMRRLAEHAFRGNAAELADAMVRALLVRQPELAVLEPQDIALKQPSKRVLWRVDTWRQAPAGEERLELVEGRFALAQELPPELETWLAAAGRSYAEALATAEMEALREVLPDSQAFFQQLKRREFKGAAWPLRLGYWTPDPQGGRLLAFARLATVAKVLERRFKVRPLPRKLFYDPARRCTLGWAVLEREG